MKVLIIGCGAMGKGIAQTLSVADETEKVALYSRRKKGSVEAIDACLSRLSRLVDKGKLSAEQSNKAIAKLTELSTLDAATDYDLVIEAVGESYEAKRAAYSFLPTDISEHTIVATNTSSLSITQLASQFTNPAKFIGLHFFNPAPLMELVEVVNGARTSKETKDTVFHYLQQVGKSPVVVEESPGFVVNRMLIPMLNEAIITLSEGVASKESIDKAMKLGAHHPMGPLELSDFIGNDVVLSIMDIIYSETGDSKYRASPLLRKMVRAGLLGRKSNEGFYTYEC